MPTNATALRAQMRSLAAFVTAKFGPPRGRIGQRWPLKDRRRRNRSIMKTYKFLDKELTYHATKGWRLVTVAA